MGSVHPFAKHQPYDPATCNAMGLAFNTAWQKLLMSGSSLAYSRYADATREAIAMYIIDRAKAGEHDVNRLRDDAVAFVLDAVHLKQA